jgi:hypothetical protein
MSDTPKDLPAPPPEPEKKRTTIKLSGNYVTIRLVQDPDAITGYSCEAP